MAPSSLASRLSLRTVLYCACKKVTTLWLTQPHLSPFGQGAATQAAQPSPAPTHSSMRTTRARPTGGKTASARNPRCQEIWQASTASSTYGGAMIRYPPRLPPTMCQNSKASPRKYHAVRQFPPVAHQKASSTRSQPAWREHATSRSLPHFFLPHIDRTPHIGNCVHVVLLARKSLSFCTSSKRPPQKRRYLVSTPPS
jgi:hypothetical protein